MRGSYNTDLIEEQWLKIANLYPIANHRGRSRTIDFREITNAILDLCAKVLIKRERKDKEDKEEILSHFPLSPHSPELRSEP